MTQPIMNFLIEGEDSDLELPELNDDSNYGHLANYVRRNERQQHARPEKLFKAVPDSEAALFDVRMTRKQKAPQTNRVPAPVVVAPNPVVADMFTQPHPIAHRFSSAGARRRTLLTEFAEATAANQRAAALSLEQTLNETHFNQLPPQCHSTPNHAPARGHPLSALAANTSTTSTSTVTTAVDKAAGVPTNIAININMNSPDKRKTLPKSNSVHNSPAALAKPSGRRCSIPPPTNMLPITEQSSITAVSMSHSIRSAAPHQSPVAASRQPSAPTTPTRSSYRQQQQQHSHQTTPRPTNSNVRVRTQSELSMTPRSFAAREKLLHTLRQKCAEKELTNLSASTLNAAQKKSHRSIGMPSSAAAAVESAVGNDPLPQPVAVEPARAAVATAAKPTRAAVVRSPAAAGERIYDMSQYIRNTVECDIITDHSPTTSQTLQNNMLNRERNTFLDNLSLKPPRRFLRAKEICESAHVMKQLEQTVRTALKVTHQRRPLYSKGDSVNDSVGNSDASGTAVDERQLRKRTVHEPDNWRSSRLSTRRSSKRRSDEMMTSVAVGSELDLDQMAKVQPIIKLRRISADTNASQQQRKLATVAQSRSKDVQRKPVELLSNSRRPNDSLLTSDEDDETPPKAQKSGTKQPIASGSSSEATDNDILDSFVQRSVEPATDTSREPAAEIHQEWQTSADDESSPDKSALRQRPKPGPLSRKRTQSNVSPEPLQRKQATVMSSQPKQPPSVGGSRIPQPKRQPAVTHAKATAKERRGTYTLPQSSAEAEPMVSKQVATNDPRRGTYTKSSRRTDDHVRVSNGPDKHQSEQQKRGTYTKSTRHVADSSDESDGDVDDAAAQRRQKRGTYTKSVRHVADDSTDYSKDIGDAPARSQKNRGTYTKSMRITADDATGQDSDVVPNTQQQIGLAKRGRPTNTGARQSAKVASPPTSDETDNTEAAQEQSEELAAFRPKHRVQRSPVASAEISVVGANSVFVPETQEPNDQDDSEDTGAYNLHSPALPIRGSTIRRSSSSSCDDAAAARARKQIRSKRADSSRVDSHPISLTRPDRSLNRVPSDPELEFVRSTSDEDDDEPLSHISPKNDHAALPAKTVAVDVHARSHPKKSAKTTAAKSKDDNSADHDSDYSRSTSDEDDDPTLPHISPTKNHAALPAKTVAKDVLARSHPKKSAKTTAAKWKDDNSADHDSDYSRSTSDEDDDPTLSHISPKKNHAALPAKTVAKDVHARSHPKKSTKTTTAKSRDDNSADQDLECSRSTSYEDDDVLLSQISLQKNAPALPAKTVSIEVNARSHPKKTAKTTAAKSKDHINSSSDANEPIQRTTSSKQTAKSTRAVIRPSADHDSDTGRSDSDENKHVHRTKPSTSKSVRKATTRSSDAEELISAKQATKHRVSDDIVENMNHSSFDEDQPLQRAKPTTVKFGREDTVLESVEEKGIPAKQSTKHAAKATRVPNRHSDDHDSSASEEEQPLRRGKSNARSCREDTTHDPDVAESIRAKKTTKHTANATRVPHHHSDDHVEDNNSSASGEEQPLQRGKFYATSGHEVTTHTSDEEEQIRAKQASSIPAQQTTKHAAKGTRLPNRHSDDDDQHVQRAKPSTSKSVATSGRENTSLDSVEEKKIPAKKTTNHAAKATRVPNRNNEDQLVQHAKPSSKCVRKATAVTSDRSSSDADESPEDDSQINQSSALVASKASVKPISGIREVARIESKSTAKKTVRTTRIGRDSTDVETSRQSDGRLRSIRQHEPTSSDESDASHQQRPANRSTKNRTTHRTVNMSVDAVNDSTTLAPVTQSHHTTACHDIEMHETIPETQALAIESCMMDSEADSDAGIRLRVSSVSSAANTVLQQPAARAKQRAGRNSNTSSDGNDDHAAGFASDCNPAMDDTFRTCSTNASLRSFTVCPSVVEPTKPPKKGAKKKAIVVGSPQPSTSAAAIANDVDRSTTAKKSKPPSKKKSKPTQHSDKSATDSGSNENATAKNGVHKPRRKRAVPTMNSWDYHPFDRKVDPEEGKNVRRTGRAPCPRKKYWSNEIELWSPLILTDLKRTAAATGRKNNFRPKRLNAAPNGTNATATSEDSTSLMSSAGILADMFAGTFVPGTEQRMQLLKDVDGGVVMGNKNTLHHRRNGNIDYWMYDTKGNSSMGYMRFNPSAKKKMCRANERMDINVMFGVLSITIGNNEELDYEAGVLIQINKGAYYKLRNRYEAVVLAYFCKRVDAELSQCE